MNEATLSKEQVDLLAMVVPHIAVVGPEECKHYLRGENRSQIPQRLKEVFVLPGAIPPSAVTVETAGYPIEETDCFTWLGHMEQFAEKLFGVKIALRDKFLLPARLPWKQILPIFDPGLTNREMVDKALKKQGLSVGEGTDVSKFTGADSEGPRLWLVERSAQPTAARSLPPKFAKQWFEGRQTHPLSLRGYGIGAGLLYKVEKNFLDPEAKTVTWFPENVFLPDGNVAYGYYNPANDKVWFNRNDPNYENDNNGFREEISRNQRSYRAPFCVRKLIQPFVILETSINCSASRR